MEVDDAILMNGCFLMNNALNIVFSCHMVFCVTMVASQLLVNKYQVLSSQLTFIVMD